MASVLTYVGEDWVCQRLAGVGAMSGAGATGSSWVAWGTGATGATKGDTTLFAESIDEVRIGGTATVVNSGASAYYQNVGEIQCAVGAKSIAEAGLFDQFAIGGNMFVRGDFAPISVSPLDKIEFTFKLNPT